MRVGCDKTGNEGIVEYFPTQVCLHERKREMFTSYGTCVAVNVVEEWSEGPSKGDTKGEKTKDVRFICQNVCQRGQQQLMAKHPSLPLLPPNNYFNLTKEPCMDDIKQNIKQSRKLLRELKLARTRMKYKSMQLRAKSLLTQLEALVEEDSQSSTRKVDEERRRLLARLQDETTFSQVRRLAATGKDLLGKSLDQMTVNPRYTGGCLSFLAFHDHDTELNQPIGAVVWPTGPYLSDLTLSPVSIVKNELQMESADCKLPLTTRVHETSVATVDGQHFAVCRHNDSCTLAELECVSDRLSAHVVSSHSWAASDLLSSVSLSPYIRGEYLVATTKGSVFLWSPSSKSRQIYKELGDIESWHGCHFGSHPRQVVLSDRASVSLLDLRDPTRRVLDLCSVSQPFLHHTDRISVTRRHPVSPCHHFVATNWSILMMDERCLKYPVLTWNHSLLTPPQYFDVACNILPASGDSVLVIASQDTPETHCFQFRDNITLRRAPQACGPPWRVSMPRDCALFSTRKGYGGDYEKVSRRLQAPLAGVCTVRHPAGGLSVIQMTSFGDTFSQSFKVCAPLDEISSHDVTCSAGIGCDSLSLEPSMLTRIQNWLTEANDQMCQLRSETASIASKVIACNAVDTFSDICRPLLAHPLCLLCQPQLAGGDAASSDLDVDVECSSCGHNLDLSRVIFMSTSSYSSVNMPDTDAVFDLPTRSSTSSMLDECLKGSDVKQYTDVESQLLVKLWNGDPDLADLLAKREKEWQNCTQNRGLDKSPADEVESASADEESLQDDEPSPKRAKLDVESNSSEMVEASQPVLLAKVETHRRVSVSSSSSSNSEDDIKLPQQQTKSSQQTSKPQFPPAEDNTDFLPFLFSMQSMFNSQG